MGAGPGSIRLDLSQLGLQEVSRSSAIQRAGRAGRTAPGLAVRLYTESDFNRRPYHSQPEILRADLSSVLLQVAASNIEHSELGWIDPPGKEIVDQARELLLRLGALDKAYRATPVGREMARLPLEPRLARFVTDATAMGAGQPACHIAAYLSTAGGRIESSAQGAFSSDLERLLAADLSRMAQKASTKLRQATRAHRVLNHDSHALEKAMLLAHPDRVARKRGETLLLSSGLSARLDSASAASGDLSQTLKIGEPGSR
jgi:ATP-dependent helicase HrpB